MTLSRRLMLAASLCTLASRPGFRRRTRPRIFPTARSASIVPFPGRRALRRAGAADRPEDDRGLGPAGRDREPARRQHRDRRADRQAGAGRRLHAADGDRLDADHEPIPLPHAALRPDQRLRAGDAGGQDHAAPDGQFGKRGEDGERPDRQGQGTAGQAQLRRRHHHRPSSPASCSTRRPACRPCWCPTTAAPRSRTAC